MRYFVLVSVVLALASCASAKAPQETEKAGSETTAVPPVVRPEATVTAATSPATAATPPGADAAAAPLRPPLPLNAAPQLAERLRRLDTVTCADLFVLNGDARTGQPQLVALSLILLGYLAAQTGDYDLGEDRVGYLGRLLRDRCVEAPARTVLSIVSGV